jgi:glycosyltransferase involved in cell wall biosynthesis
MTKKRMLFLIKGGAEWIGGLHYIKNLIKTVKHYNPLPEYTIEADLLVYNKEQAALFADIKNDVGEIYVQDELLSNAGLLKRAMWLRKRRFSSIFNPFLDEFIKGKGYDFAYPCMPRSDFNDYRFAEWIPDFQYKHFPDGSNQQEIQGRINEFSSISSNAPLIYVSSEHAKRDCEELFPASGGKLRVMQFCVYTDAIRFSRPLNELLSRYNIPRKYFIVSNLLAPTKNLEVVIKAVGMLKAAGHPVSVVVTGDIHDYRNPGFKHKIFQLTSQENVRENMIFLGLIDRLDQKQLLANSISIIQPSRFEGWNTLVEEAKCIDKHIVLSDIPVHLEQRPAKGIYFRDNDPADLAARLRELYSSSQPEAEATGIEISAQYKDNITRFAAHFINTSLFDSN